MERGHEGTTPRAARGVVFMFARLASLLVAGLLLFGAVMKGATHTASAGDWFGWGQIGGEALLAAGLVLLHRRWWMWGVIAFVFAGFAGFTMERLFGGAASCGCFGSLTVPPRVTLGIDAGVFVASVLLMRVMGAGASAMTGVGALAIPAAIAGGVYAMSLPSPKDFRMSPEMVEAMQEAQGEGSGASAGAGAPEVTVFDPLSMRATEAMRLVPRVAGKAGAQGAGWVSELGEATGAVEPVRPAWLVFVYDPDCHVCQQFLPSMRSYAAEARERGDAYLRVILIEKKDLAEYGIEDWAWPASPTTALLWRGGIVHEWGGEETPEPRRIRERLEKEGAAYIEELKKNFAPLKLY